MDVRTRWRRLDAEAGVHVFGMVFTAVCTLWALWALILGLAAGLVLVGLLAFAVPALAGWLTSAWGRERPWAWWVWTALAGAVLLSAASALLGGRPWGIAGVVVSGGLLLLLLHPGSRARSRPAAGVPVGHSGT